MAELSRRSPKYSRRARSATITASTTMPTTPAVVHDAGSNNTTTLPATQARSATKTTRAQVPGSGSREAIQAQSTPKITTPTPSSSSTMAKSRPATASGAVAAAAANGVAKAVNNAPLAVAGLDFAIVLELL